MSYFCLNLGQTAEDSDMFTIIWLRPIGLNRLVYGKTEYIFGFKGLNGYLA